MDHNNWEIIRTPDERFNNLPNFPFDQHYVTCMGLRVHYVDEGKGPVILCLHGEPTWAFLYRKMIPLFVQVGYRVIAPDFIGFGRSDKIVQQDAYSFQLHYNILRAFIATLKLKDITLIVHDWGGLIGLPVATFNPTEFARLVILNTFLPTGEEKVTGGFLAWRAVAQKKELIASLSVKNGCFAGKDLPADVLRAYDAPFPDVRYKAGMQAFPLLVPLTPTDPGAKELKETREKLRSWSKPAIVIFAPDDPVLGGASDFFRKLIPTVKDQPIIRIRHALHFLQEDKGEEIAQHIIDFLDRTKETIASTNA